MDDLNFSSHAPRWIEQANEDAEFLRCARWTDVRFSIVVDAQRHDFRIREGKLASEDPPIDEEVIVLRGDAHAWRKFMLAEPPPPFHNVLAMDRRYADFAIDSGRHQLIQNLMVITRALELMREAASPVKGNTDGTV